MWKLNSESCDHWDVHVPGWTQESIPIIPFEIDSLSEGYKPSTGIYFKIKTFGVVIHSLGMLSKIFELNEHTNSTLQLILKNTKNGEILENIKFNITDESEAEYTYKSVSTARGLELAPGFEGWLYLAKPASLNLPNLCTIMEQQHLGSHGVLYFTGLTLLGSSVKKRYASRNCLLLNLEYSLTEPTDTMHHLAARETQNQVETRRMRGIEADVAEELEDHDDLAFLPTIDSAHAASRNIKYFLETIEDINYDYLLVTTDSSLINIDLVLNHLSGANSFWSAFRHSVKPGDLDLRYEAATFPPLPSPSFVLARHLAQFLPINSGYLAEFSKLPVSMGVWMSALSPDYRDDSRWQGGQEVVNRTELWRQGKLIVLEGLSAQEMDSIWKD
eukprot:TRINITY_DN3253_c0_g2_i2.p1 TRINITY_DN3253_c0_g2~~TRINITY_DN3253_c0_g2_i2.p1  ORF type:complete len:388 (+),score=80.97 TRINITY_DN3253_c0_g2_i2:740-1903(+)